MDNYDRQALQAKKTFLTYDHNALAKKLGLPLSDEWLQTRLWGQPYRISTLDANIQKLVGGVWRDANGFNETMTLLDLICDCRKDRCIRGTFRNMADFGLMFHRQLLEQDPWAHFFQAHLEHFRQACLALGATPFPLGDAAYTFQIFEDLPVVVQLWLGDEEFPPNLHLLWDENALMYIKYETMYFAKGLLFGMIRSQMKQ